LIVYVNGDSHSAGAEAVNTFCFADDDPRYRELGRRPHPDNLAVSYGQILANKFNAELVCDAESGSSNTRILRTTYQYLKNNTPDLVVIGWATWEREEVVVDGEVYQFSAYLITDPFPPAVKQRYKEWAVDRLNPQIHCEQAQKEIMALHEYLNSKNIRHIFFNTYSGLTPCEQLDWHGHYFQPYDHNQSYYKLLSAWNFKPIKENSFHFGPDAHATWADMLYNLLTNPI